MRRAQCPARQGGGSVSGRPVSVPDGGDRLRGGGTIAPMRRAWRDVGAVLAIALLTGALLVFALLYQRESALRSGE